MTVDWICFVIESIIAAVTIEVFIPSHNMPKLTRQPINLFDIGTLTNHVPLQQTLKASSGSSSRIYLIP